MEDTHVHALDYVSVVRRRKWWLAVPIAASVIIGLALIMFLPKEYTSTATLGVVAPIVSPTVVSPSSPLDNQERLRVMSQQLTSVQVLSRVLKDEGLSAGAANDPEIGRLRSAIKGAPLPPGAHALDWRAVDSSGRPLPSGVYVVRMTAADRVESRRVVLVR